MKVGSDFAGMRSLAVSYPRGIRTNEYFRTNYPDVVAAAEKKTLAKIWAAPGENAKKADAFDAEMKAYLGDPFRGSVRRRVLAKGETSLALELTAAKDALAAARMQPQDVDLMIVGSLRPDTIGVGNAAYLSAELGLRGAAWNLETACSSSVVGLQTANALVRAGDYGNVLVVTSCTYSRDADESDSLSWFLGDGAGAFVVCPSRGPDGVLGSKTVHTADTCGAFYYDMMVTSDGSPRFRMNADAEAARVLRDSAIVYLRECCEGALGAASMRLSDVDFFIFNTPTAWYAKFCARALGVDVSRTIDTYPLYANIGPALMPSNLYRAARTNRIRQGDVVLLYAIGSSSTASATVMRWGEVNLGPDPEDDVVG